ncbi:UDP-glucose:glycoprotein glucosyltransferase, putative [Talaromyces stipitatus ATCC 10500]|uniref:UDP-glucose:glycoprotein glucosyltransferase, putative n=1 Tax=Talaromyces stipitatus (strain ATCC 10500 / CBS 375.48 / QM 6759 / NRRL 1006) TaxID=441959 RepID=B8M6X7_TALSN|nr:UDP-glucose:glycoprotein glucosyltransferase, putative [Talaromyces stipitatus ATCC 10500]EED20197.1 UDP-glucose:glycoprotein glucosyltransferase, putative [Talaromyces stipitatus ATCC 10500]
MMRASLFALATSLLVLLQQPQSVVASPDVNVALRASFDAGPYLVELLETAAQENSSAYFPLLDRIATGTFEDATTDKDLYETFLQVLIEDNHLQSKESLDSFKFALAIRSAAPRIEAHYQYYNTSVQSTLGTAQDAACPVWVHMDGKQYCSSTLERAQQDVSGDRDPRELPFDRTLGDRFATPAVLYADIASPMFADYHRTLKGLANEGQIAYRVRYRPAHDGVSRPLFVSGYGVELTLKRTDYIVIDDRQAEEKDTTKSNAKTPSAQDLDAEEDESPLDLKPLSSSEVAKLGMSAASFVLDSSDPFATLVKLSQDFPKYSSSIAAYNASEQFLEEYKRNRQAGLPGGRNAMWINGLHVDARQIDAFSLLEYLRRERRLLAEFQKIGLSASEAVDLLSYPALAEVQGNSEVQRYDWRDEIEGGGVLVWLNDLEKDKRYTNFPTTLQALLQPTYPGQFPAVRRDVQNVVVPVDLANTDDVQFVAKYLYAFIKRMIPVRFGLVLTTNSEESKAQAKIAHYLHQAYGLASMLQYLETSLSAEKVSRAHKPSFTAAIAERSLRSGQENLSFEEVLQSDALDTIISNTEKYLNRLDLKGSSPSTLVNGVAMSRGGNYMQELPMQLSRDLQIIQQGLIEGAFSDDDYVPDYFLSKAAQSRNEWIVPEHDSDIVIADICGVADLHNDFAEILRFPADPKHTASNVQLIVVADFNTEHGLALLLSALKFRQTHPGSEIVPLYSSDAGEKVGSIPSKLYELLRHPEPVDFADVLTQIQSRDNTHQADKKEEEQAYWTLVQQLVTDIGLPAGSSSLIFNSRVVGPLPSSVIFKEEDIEALFSYETSQRLGPVSTALKDLGIESKVAGPLNFAKLTSLVMLSTNSDAPEGVFEQRSKYRVDVWKRWNSTHSAVDASTNTKDASINIAAAIDPTSEISQKWLPILKTLSKLAGVNVRIYLAPNGQLSELPIKRFYRHVLESEPTFDENRALARPEASFHGLPQDALLTLGMDVPSSWLVAPKWSIHDLDNIKLSAIKDSSDVDAIYELEHILIEGHSTDMTLRSPPRGVQLLLETEKGSFFADTIVMANLGYFQFKAQPGFWKIELKEGRSRDIFQLDSIGGGQESSGTNEVALLSFQGKTLFPRLSRKPGQENEEVLETGPRPGSAMDYVSKGLNFAQGVLSSVGVKQTDKSESAEKHAEINIFSVASGHLYERMLNIMMVSVMKNTKHSVKFWFIEQFLSPSFTSLLPHLANEYGFTYEMVTYKWPHWLRGQREKQREIWGYKILFLDVLFPLSLDKVIFVDADQIVRTDMYDLVTLDLEGAPYGFTPMCDSREEMEGFRFWKQGYWKSYLGNLKYHISALYVVDLQRFRELAAGDRLRGQYHTLSADPESLANLDQDLPNNMQTMIPIKSLPQDWLWCETWCSDEALKTAKTIDLCNNPLTKEPKLERARRQVPEWTVYDEEIAELARRVASSSSTSPENESEEEEEGEGKVYERKDEL